MVLFGNASSHRFRSISLYDSLVTETATTQGRLEAVPPELAIAAILNLSLVAGGVLSLIFNAVAGKKTVAVTDDKD